MKHCSTAMSRENEKNTPAPSRWTWRFDEAWNAATVWPPRAARRELRREARLARRVHLKEEGEGEREDKEEDTWEYFKYIRGGRRRRARGSPNEPTEEAGIAFMEEERKYHG